MIDPQLLFHRSFTKRRRNARAADVVAEQNPLERRIARQQTAKFRQVHALSCLFQRLARATAAAVCSLSEISRRDSSLMYCWSRITGPCPGTMMLAGSVSSFSIVAL